MRRVFYTIQEARLFLECLVYEDCKKVGITDWNTIRELIRTKQCRYKIVVKKDFNDEGQEICSYGYRVIKR